MYKLWLSAFFMLVQFPISANAQKIPLPDQDQAALEEAIEIKKKLLDGADFTEMAQKFSDDTGSAMQGGTLGFMDKGQLVPEYEQTALALAVGEISEPVKSEFGYHIIQLLEIKEGAFNSRHILIKP